MKKKIINILSLQTTSEIGGADLILYRTLKGLDKKYFKPFVLLPKDGPVVELFKEAGVEVIFLPMKKISKRLGWNYIVSFFLQFRPTCSQVERICKENEIDVIHANTMHSPYGWLPSKRLKIPLIWHIREILTHSSFIGNIEKGYVEKYATKIVAMSQAIADSMFPNSNKLKLIYDGVDTKVFSDAGPNMRGRWGLTTDDFVVGLSARIDPWKGVKEFIQSIAIAKKSIPQLKALICGGAIEGHQNYYDECCALIEELGLSQNMVMTDWNVKGDDMNALYRSMDVLVNSSTSPEPFGMSVIEAQACGVPVVSGKAGGPSETIDDGVTGYLIDQVNSESLSEALVKLYQAPLSSHLCRQRVVERFELAKGIRQFEKVVIDAMAI